MSRFFIIFVIIIIFNLTVLLAAHISDGYIGCFKDYLNRVLKGKSRHSNTNSAEECINYCKADFYRYAGTESEDECFCGNYLRAWTNSNSCNHLCTGNKNEICGGHWALSVYDISRIKYDEKTTKLTSSTTEIKTVRTKTTSREEETSSSSKSTYSSYRTSSSTGLTTSIANITLNTTHNPNVEKEGESQWSLVIVYVAAPLAFLSLIAGFLVAFIIRRRKRKIEDRTRFENVSKGTGSMPNIYANIVLTREQPEYGIGDNEYSDVFDEKNERNLSIPNTTNEINNDKYKRKHHKDIGQTDSMYNIVANLMNDGSYSVCSRKKFQDGHNDTDNIYAHVKDIGNPSCANDTEDNMYNTLSLKKNSRFETYRDNYVEKSDSVYDTTIISLSLRVDEGEYSHFNEMTLT